jgi:hypothetical protein
MKFSYPRLCFNEKIIRGYCEDADGKFVRAVLRNRNRLARRFLGPADKVCGCASGALRFGRRAHHKDIVQDYL